MASLEARIAALESVLLAVKLDNLSDAELEAHIATLPRGSAKRLEATIALIMRRRSMYPVTEVDPAYTEGWLDDDQEP